MAVDTADKRASATGRLWFRILPVPDGTISLGDQYQVGGVYRDPRGRKTHASPHIYLSGAGRTFRQSHHEYP